MDYLELSVNTERAMALPRPRWRGVSHRLAAVLSPVIFTLLAMAAPAGPDRIAIILYGIASTVMFSISAIVHLRPWTASKMEALFRLDHTGIYVMIGGTALAVASTGLEGSAQQWLIALTLVAAAIGTVIEWLPFPTPTGVGNAIYLTMGWLVVLFIPAMYGHVGIAPIVWLFAGGLCYTIGAVIVGVRRPDPDPDVFGYHEIWHLLVIAAVILHAIMFITLW